MFGRHIILIVLVLSSFQSIAQKQVGWQKSEVDRNEVRKFRNNYFHSIGFSPIINFFVINYKYTYEFDMNVVERSTSDFNFCLFSFQYDARYNVFNYRDFFSLSVSSSPMIAFNFGDYSSGLFTQVPIGLDLNFFLHSTFNNIQNVGVSLSGGMQLNRSTDARRSAEGPIGWKEYYGKFLFKYRKYKFKINPYKKNKNYYNYLGVQIGRGNADMTVDGVFEEHTNKSIRLIFGKILSY